jgi:hypothetical protein
MDGILLPGWVLASSVWIHWHAMEKVNSGCRKVMQRIVSPISHLYSAKSTHTNQFNICTLYRTRTQTSHHLSHICTLQKARTQTSHHLSHICTLQKARTQTSHHLSHICTLHKTRTQKLHRFTNLTSVFCTKHANKHRIFYLIQGDYRNSRDISRYFFKLRMTPASKQAIASNPYFFQPKRRSSNNWDSPVYF